MRWTTMTSTQAAVAGIEPASRRLTVAHPYQHEYHRIIIFLFHDPAFRGVRVAGFEPAISCFQGTRVRPDFPTPCFKKSAQRESNPHFRHGKTVGCRYIMGADWFVVCLVQEHQVGFEPTLPRYKGSVLPG